MIATPRLVQTGLWRRMDCPGLERYEVRSGAHEWVLRGTILVMAENFPAEARYEIVCDDSWLTRRADIFVRDRSGERSLTVVAENGVWLANGARSDAIEGCADIDLEWSPSTNTLPIRRLRLAVGESSGVVTAAWVRFPSLEIQPLSQEYERVAPNGYRYASGGGTFIAKLEVDEEGLVIDYEGVWRRELAKSSL